MGRLIWFRSDVLNVGNYGLDFPFGEARPSCLSLLVSRPDSMAPWRIVPTGILLRVRATPRARTDEVRGIVPVPGTEGAGDGLTDALAVSTRAAPDGGAANTGITSTLAAALRVPPSRVSVVAGATARVKRVLVEVPQGEAEELVRRLQELG